MGCALTNRGNIDGGVEKTFFIPQFVGKTDASIEMRCSACEADCTTTY